MLNECGAIAILCFQEKLGVFGYCSNEQVIVLQGLHSPLSSTWCWKGARKAGTTPNSAFPLDRHRKPLYESGTSRDSFAHTNLR